MKLEQFRGKRVLVMGLGLHGGGVGTAKFFAARGARITVTDLKSRRALAPSLRELRLLKNITYHLGGHRENDFKHTDYVIPNPGVPEKSRYLQIATRSGAKILSDIELFFLACKAEIIGVTGTKGKSTTTWLIGEFLKQQTRNPGRPLRADSGLGKKQDTRVWVAGNIRRSVLEILPRVKKGDWVVLELSSFQLDSLARIRMSPARAVITNIFPDHLNRYSSMRSYIASKKHIVRFQDRAGVLYVNANDRTVSTIARKAQGTVHRVSTPKIFKKFRSAFKIPPPHFHESNIAIAIQVARDSGVSERAIRKVLRNFHGIPGRMERVGTVHGVQYINDTTATNPEASALAIREVKRRIGSHKLILIAGGFDKGLPLSNFIRTIVLMVQSVIFLPGSATGKMETELLQQGQKIHPVVTVHARTMHEAVDTALNVAKIGDAVLLSPGAASFGLFKHEFDRGDQFVKEVRLIHSRSSR